MIHYITQAGPASQQTTDCLVLPYWENATPTPSFQALDQASQGHVGQWVKTEDFTGKTGQTLLLRDVPGVTAPRILLVGCGEPNKFTPTQFYQAVTLTINTVRCMAITHCCAYLLEFALRTVEWQLYHAILACDHTLYRFDRFKSQKDPDIKLQTFSFGLTQASADFTAVIARAQAIARAVKLTRDLGNLPSNVCTPTYLAEQALAQAKAHPALKTTVLEQVELEKLGMQAFLSVARGSVEPPKLITLEYQGSTSAPIVLVGKGVTFDSGGISLKPGASMDEMRYDMCGAATVLSVLSAAAELKLPLNLVGIMACTENMPSGKAYKPGDIVQTLSGQTIEILNTDAEGRVVLADALAYAARFNPDTVIDIATLTGAIIVALGDKASGLMTTDTALATEISAAGESSWDRVWPLPLWEEYQEQIKSPFADMANIGSEGGKSITAACLLSRFTTAYRWAHLDIAGTAWQSGKNKTATGRPVPLLMDFLFKRCP